MSNSPSPPPLPRSQVRGAILPLVSLFWADIVSPFVRVVRIDDRCVYLKGVCGARLDTLPER